MKKLTLMIAVLLAGCGGGGVRISLPGPVPEPVTDAFFAQVKKVVASMPEDTEAAAIDSLAAATAPEDNESVAL